MKNQTSAALETKNSAMEEEDTLMKSGPALVRRGPQRYSSDWIADRIAAALEYVAREGMCS
jgi:hypothetical protein